MTSTLFLFINKAIFYYFFARIRKNDYLCTRKSIGLCIYKRENSSRSSLSIH